MLSMENYFGLDRDPKIEIGGFTIRPDRNVPQFRVRSWRERLFSFPWRPLVRIEDQDIAFIMDKNILVSWKTFSKLKDEG